MVKVSQVKQRITPMGKFFPILMPNGKWAQDVADEQYASILLLEINGENCLWISLDAIGCGEEFTLGIREKVSHKFNISLQNINIGYTHSHCAPRLGDGRGPGKPDLSYMSFVSDLIEDGVGRCVSQGLVEVEVSAKSYDALGFYSNRNGLDKVGDNEIKLIEFRDVNGVVKAIILSYACHSTVVNFQISRSLTSDLAGVLSRGIEERFGIYPLVMLGAAGDMSNRCCRQGNDFVELKRVGDGLLSRIDIKTESQKLELNSLSVEPYEFKETYVTTKEERQSQIAKIKEQIANAKTADLKRVFNSALSHAELESEGGTFVLDVKGSIIRLGDIEICTMPAELFSCLGLQIKQAMNVKCPIFWGYSNYSCGYLYNKEEFGKSFESAATNIPVGVPEQITEMLVDKVK